MNVTKGVKLLHGRHAFQNFPAEIFCTTSLWSLDFTGSLHRVATLLSQKAFAQISMETLKPQALCI